MLFGILGHERNVGMAQTLKQQLLKIGIAKDNIRIFQRFEMAKLKIPNHVCQEHEICHYSVLHRWIPRVARWLKRRHTAKIPTHVVWFLEDNCQLAQLKTNPTIDRELLSAASLVDMASKQAITWPGYRKVTAQRWHEFQYGHRYIVNGNHMLSFRGDGLQSLYDCLRSSSQYCHIDALMTRSLPSFYLPSFPCVGTRRKYRTSHDDEVRAVNYSKLRFLKPHPKLESKMEQNEDKKEQGEIIAHSEELSIGTSNDVDCVAMQKRVFDEFLAHLQSDSNDVELANKNLVVEHTNLGKNYSDAQRASTVTRVPDAKKQKIMNDMLSRCQSNHVQVEDLALDPLPKNGFTCRTMLFCILGHNLQI